MLSQPLQVDLPLFRRRRDLLPALHVFGECLVCRVRDVAWIEEAWVSVARYMIDDVEGVIAQEELTSFDTHEPLHSFRLDIQAATHQHPYYPPSETYDPQVSHHARVMLLPLTPLTVCVRGSGPSNFALDVSAKMCAEYLMY